MIGVVAALVLVRSPARADDKKRACAAAYMHAQELRRSGKLIEARDALITCSQPSCPAAAVADCGPWLAEVEESMPSVVIAARDASGRESSEVRVLVDGRLVATSLDGRALPLDPGAHLFRYEPAHGSAVEETVVIRQGEKNRTLLVPIDTSRDGEVDARGPRAGEAKGSSPGSSERPVPMLTWLFGAAGIAGLGVFAGFGAASLSAEAKLRASCAPHCPADEIAAIRAQHTAADIGLGFGVVSVGIATFYFLTRPPLAKAGPARMRTEVVRPFIGIRAVGVEGVF